MKSCPNCGAVLEGKLKCDCGYDTVSGEVDENINKEFKNNEASLYGLSCDNMSMMSGVNQFDSIAGAKMMGINPKFSDNEITKQLNQPIFNKENDNIYGEELLNILRNNNENEKEKESDLND